MREPMQFFGNTIEHIIAIAPQKAKWHRTFPIPIALLELGAARTGHPTACTPNTFSHAKESFEFLPNGSSFASGLDIPHGDVSVTTLAAAAAELRRIGESIQPE